MKIKLLSLFLLTSFVLFSCTGVTEKEEASTPDNAAIAKALYASFAEGDVETVIAGMDPEIEWNEAENFIYADGNPYVGPEAVVNGVFARLGAEWEYWNLTDTKILNLENGQVLVTGRYQAKLKRTGGVLNAQFVHVWTMKDGKVAKFQQYADTKQTAEVYYAESDNHDEDEEGDDEHE